MGHNADVKCLGLGHKSGRVMVTGGDDRKVNLWSVGKPNCIMVRPFTLFFSQFVFCLFFFLNVDLFFFIGTLLPTFFLLCLKSFHVFK